MADGLESACRDVEGSVQKIEAQMDSLKRQMAECGFDTDLGNAEEIPSWPKFWETSIRG
jgi:hypothetical protein